MLIQCWECEQIMDIASLDQHFLEECTRSENYKLCNKCKSV
jgi:hypothetical protein